MTYCLQEFARTLGMSLPQRYQVNPFSPTEFYPLTKIENLQNIVYPQNYRLVKNQLTSVTH